jgi:hypothetical protein
VPVFEHGHGHLSSAPPTRAGGGLKASMTLKADVDCSLYVLDRAIFVAIMKHETMMKNRLAFMRSVCLDGTAVFKAFTDSDMMRWALQFVEFTADPGYHFTEQVRGWSLTRAPDTRNRLCASPFLWRVSSPYVLGGCMSSYARSLSAYRTIGHGALGLSVYPCVR